MPSVEELSLEEPEIVRQGGRYGVRLRASAPSIHMMRANIKAEVNPIVGTDTQSEALVHYLLSEFAEHPEKIWAVSYTHLSADAEAYCQDRYLYYRG